jgi:tetratricopeptide (TPR) repeat protein
MRKIFLAACLSLIGFAFIANAQPQIASPEAVRKAGERMSQGDIAGAMAILDKAIEKKKDLFEIYRMRSALRMMSRDVNGAIDELTRALEIKPNDAETYAIRADFLMFVRKNELALKDYDSAIAYGLKTEKAFTGRANIKRDMGDYDAAIADYQAAIALRPLYASAHIGLAVAFELQGKPDAATAQLEGFVNQYEEYKNGKLPKVKGEQIGEIVSIERKDDEKNGTETFLRGEQTRMEIKGNMTPEALQRLNEQMEQRMNAAVAYLNLASSYRRRNDFDKALATIEKSLAMKPGDPASIALRGGIRLDKGDVGGALEDLNEAIRRMPGNFAPLADRGIALLMQGKDAEAQKDFDKFLQMFPNGRENLNKRIAAVKEKRDVQPQ